MSLRVRIVAAIVLALIAGSGLGMGLAGWHAREWLRGELLDAQRGGELALARAYADLPQGARAKQELVDIVATFSGDRHMQARLLDRAGHVLAASDPERSASAPAWFAGLVQAKIPNVRIAAPGTSGLAVVLSPVYANDTAALWRQFVDLGLTLILSGLLGVSLVVIVVRRALSPMTALSAVLPRIGAGDYATRAPLAGPPELARLAQGVNDMAERLAAMRDRNRSLEEQMLTLQDEERADIARDLHDEIGPHLFAANVDAAMTTTLIGAGETGAALEQVRSIQAAIAHIQRRVRDILGRLRPPRLAELGLCAAILDLIAFWQGRRPEIRFEARLPPVEDGLPETIQETAYRLVQESLSNAVRHGGGRVIAVTLVCEADALLVEVSNDGPAASGSAPGYGLSGMRERVAQAGGTLEAGPAPAGGWRVAARLPLGRPSLESAA